MKAWRVVWSKELRDVSRDHRTLFSSFLLGIVLPPLGLALMVLSLVEITADAKDDLLELPLRGGKYAPNLVHWLHEQGAVIRDVTDTDEELATQFTEKKLQVVLSIPESFPTDWEAGRPGEVELWYDRSNQSAFSTVDRTKRLLQAFQQLRLVQRLWARGISPDVLSPLRVEEKDQSTARSRGSMLLSIFPYLLFLTIFSSGLAVAVDATAGERERKSLEPLLLCPVPRSHIMWGKMFAAATLSWLALGLSLTILGWMVPLLPVRELGIELSLTFSELFFIFALLTPLSAVAAALITGLASFAKGYREATTYVSLVAMAPGLISVFTAIRPLEPDTGYFFVPILSHQLLIEAITQGKPYFGWQFAAAVGSTLLVALMLGFMTSRLYHRERLAISA